MMQMYDRVIASGNVDTLVLLSIIAFDRLLLVMSLFEMMRNRILVKLGTAVDRELSGAVLSRAMNDSLRAGGLNGANYLRELNTLCVLLTGAGILRRVWYLGSNCAFGFSRNYAWPTLC